MNAPILKYIFISLGKGHSFYTNKDQGYSFHENQNQGYRNYQSKDAAKKWMTFSNMHGISKKNL